MFGLYKKPINENINNALRDEFIKPFLDELIAEQLSYYSDIFDPEPYDHTNDGHKDEVFLWLIKELPVIDTETSFTNATSKQNHMSQRYLLLVREYVESNRPVIAKAFREIRVSEKMNSYSKVITRGFAIEIDKKFREAPKEGFEGKRYLCEGYSKIVTDALRPIAERIIDTKKKYPTPDYESDYLIWISKRAS